MNRAASMSLSERKGGTRAIRGRTLVGGTNTKGWGALGSNRPEKAMAATAFAEAATMSRTIKELSAVQLGREVTRHFHASLDSVISGFSQFLIIVSIVEICLKL